MGNKNNLKKAPAERAKKMTENREAKNSYREANKNLFK
jgi:hypothetical protein